MKHDTQPHKYLSFKFSLVAVLPLLTLGFLILHFLIPRMEEQTISHHENLARSLASQISAHLMGGERQLLALSAYMQENVGFEWGTITSLLDAQCGEGDLFEAIYLASRNDQRVEYVGLSREAVGSHFSAREDLLGLDLSGRKFISESKGGQQLPYWSETFLSTVSSHLAVALTVPISDYLIIGEITLYRLSELLSNLPLNWETSTLVLDRNGRIIADSQKRRWGEHLDISALPVRMADGTDSISSISFELDGEQMLGTMVKVRHLGWTVLVSLPRRVADRPKLTAFATLSAGLGFALLLSLVVAWMQAAKLTKAFTRYVQEKQKSQQELLLAKQAAETASNAKSEFLANMSHDLRTPLNGIMGMMQLLGQTEVNEEQREYIRIALKSSKRLTMLLSDILDLSRVEAGKMPLRQEPFDLIETVDQVIDLFSITFRQSGVELLRYIHPRVSGMLLGDSARLQQVLNNLLGNAAKFTSRGIVSLELYPLPRLEEEKDRLLVTVTDTGIGIEKVELAHLFEPFRQVEDEANISVQGAGLGLAICKKLVNLMDGEIFVESEPGCGTTFSFCVTFGECTSLKKQPVVNDPILEKDFFLFDILVAEDEPINAITVKCLLEKEGCSPTVVGNGEEAIAALANRSYHAVFLDIQMPVMGGLETVQAIRQGEAGEHNIDIPAFALTAFAMNGDKEKCLEKGMDGYLAKPISIEALRSALQQVLSMNQQRAVDPADT